MTPRTSGICPCSNDFLLPACLPSPLTKLPGNSCTTPPALYIYAVTCQLNNLRAASLHRMPKLATYCCLLHRAAIKHSIVHSAACRVASHGCEGVSIELGSPLLRSASSSSSSPPSSGELGRSRVRATHIHASAVIFMCSTKH